MNTFNDDSSLSSTPQGMDALGPSVELFHPPKLGIIHLIAWAGVMAALVNCLASVGWFGAFADDYPGVLRIFSIASMLVYVAFVAAGLVGIAVIFLARLRGVGGRLQAGHWMVIILSVSSVFSLLIWLLAYVFDIRERSVFFTFFIVQNVLTFWLWLVAALRVYEPFRWKAMLGFFAFCSAVSCTFHLRSMTSTSAVSLSLGDCGGMLFNLALGLIVLPTLVLLDIRHKTRRDWLHWLGVAIVVFPTLVPATTQLVCMLAY